MKAFHALAVLSALSLTPAMAAAPARPSTTVPTLSRAPALDGVLKDLAGGATVTPQGNKVFSAKVAFFKNTLYLGVELTDDTLVSGDLLDVSLHFPEAGLTARGYAYRFSFDGKRAPESEVGAPAFANDLVQTAVQRKPHGMVIEAAFPARSLPRFPAREPLLFELCLNYADRDEVAGTSVASSNCVSGTAATALKLPATFLKSLKLSPPKNVEGVEATATGWLGFSTLHHPNWVLADTELTPGSLRSMAAPTPPESKELEATIPASMSLPDGRELFTVLSGRNPFAAAQGPCDSEKEVRLWLYLVQAKTAIQVLDWPVASCALGRALSFVVDDDGSLAIGYSNGSLAHFAWSQDHFEHTQFGKR